LLRETRTRSVYYTAGEIVLVRVNALRRDIVRVAWLLRPPFTAIIIIDGPSCAEPAKYQAVLEMERMPADNRALIGVIAAAVVRALGAAIAFVVKVTKSEFTITVEEFAFAGNRFGQSAPPTSLAL